MAWEVAKSKHKGQRVKGIAALLLLRKINRSRSAPSPYRRAEQLTSGMTPGPQHASYERRRVQIRKEVERYFGD